MVTLGFQTISDSASVPGVEFIGIAESGKLFSQGVWMIFKKETVVGKGVIIRPASGLLTFTNVWDNRDSLSYS